MLLKVVVGESVLVTRCTDLCVIKIIADTAMRILMQLSAFLPCDAAFSFLFLACVPPALSIKNEQEEPSSMSNS